MAKTNTKAKKKKPVILQVLPELSSGGVERGTVEVSKALSSKGFVSIVASAGGHLVSPIVSSGGLHFKLPLASKNPFTIYRNISRLVKIIIINNVDIVHARSRAPAWSAYFACKKTGCHFVTTVHGSYSTGGYFKKAYNSVMTKGEKIIIVSEYIKKYVKKNYTVKEKNIVLIHRGVDLSHFDRVCVPERRVIQKAEQLQIEHDRSVILLPGRITSWKGHDFLLDALAEIDKDKFYCLFVGDLSKHPSYVKRLQNRIVSLGLTNSVRIIGAVRDMPALYLLADIVVSASMRPEAFGRIAIEAQAMERLVVATNHGGACETVIDGKTGWLVEPDDKDGMTKILKKLIKISDKQRRTITSRAKKHIKDNFSLECMTKQTLDVYSKLGSLKK